MARQTLVVIGGAPATGKTTLATMLEKRTGFVRVSMDEIKEALFDAVGYRDREWSKEIGRMAFPVFQNAIDLHLSRQEPVIAEATFLWPSDADWLHNLSARHGCEIKQVWMTANPVETRRRFVERANTSRHPGHNDDLEYVMDEFDERFFNRSFIPLPLKAKTFIVDTSGGDPVDHEAIHAFICDI